MSLKFFDLLMITIGAQVGSGCFFMPTVLNQYGFWSTLGIFSSGCAMLCFSFVLEKLEQLRLEKKEESNTCPIICSERERILLNSSTTASYIGIHLGFTMGRISAWVYWFVAWFSSVPLLSMIIENLLVVFPTTRILRGSLFFSAQINQLFIVAFIILGLSLVNYRSMQNAAFLETFLNIFKAFCFIFLPLMGFLFFFKEMPINLTYVSNNLSSIQNLWSTLNEGGTFLIKSATLSLWGFLGIETVTSFRESVDKDSRAMSQTLFFGTVIVTSIYLLNNIVFLTILPDANIKAPYLFLLNSLWPSIYSAYSGYSLQIMAFLTVIVIMSTINAWIISVAQISDQCAQSNYFPKIFLHYTPQKPSFYSVFIPTLGMLLVYFIMAQNNFYQSIDVLIDISVLLIVWIYFLCALALLVFLIQNKTKHKKFYLFCANACLFYFSICLGSNGFWYNLYAIMSAFLFFVTEKLCTFVYFKNRKESID